MKIKGPGNIFFADKRFGNNHDNFIIISQVLLDIKTFLASESEDIEMIRIYFRMFATSRIRYYNNFILFFFLYLMSPIY